MIRFERIGGRCSERSVQDSGSYGAGAGLLYRCRRRIGAGEKGGAMTEEPERQVDDSEFLDMAKDPAEARLLRKSLETLAGGGAGPVLQEMARDVLAGRMGLRDAARSGAYAEAMVDGAQQFMAEWDEKSEAERAEIEEEGRRLRDAEQREMEEERRRTPPPGSPGSSGKPPKHGGDWSL
ncbi:hypothetical protein GL263_16730 [Streptomyces durbertensis]|uniref:Uncharacterized protein n=1 Tax=Streptomyces durbertensis TaxID=2448886 RepID=A0ABR6EJS1_9ACTN|nr:hypothetical protein [Streptomyces durbertensis]MBB1245205.1 hypothetical protein [Streptomyces durbertensis]